jgi:hypothetical protein
LRPSPLLLCLQRSRSLWALEGPGAPQSPPATPTVTPEAPATRRCSTPSLVPARALAAAASAGPPLLGRLVPDTPPLSSLGTAVGLHPARVGREHLATLPTSVGVVAAQVGGSPPPTRRTPEGLAVVVGLRGLLVQGWPVVGSGRMEPVGLISPPAPCLRGTLAGAEALPSLAMPAAAVTAAGQVGQEVGVVRPSTPLEIPAQAVTVRMEWQ